MYERARDATTPTRPDRRAGSAAAAAAHAADEQPGPVGNQATARLLRSAGTALPTEARQRLEVRVGADLADVRVHAGPEAADAARAADAVAFTAGAHIVLAGEVADAERAGILAHETTHVVQQRRATRVVPGVSGPADAAERAAGGAGTGRAGAAPAGGTVPAVQRQPTGTTSTSASRAEVEAALTDYLRRVRQEQGGQTLHNTDQVRWAVRRLFAGDPIRSASIEAWLSGVALPGDPADFARQVARQLPATIPADRLATLRTAPAKEPPDTRPKTFGEAAGGVVVDSTVTPIVRGLQLSPAWQQRIIDGAKSAVADGLVGLVDVAMDQAGVTGAAKSSIHSIVEGLIKQRPGTPMGRQQEGAGSPSAPVVPPTAAPKFPSAPGEKIFTSPAIPFDIPATRPPPRPSAPPTALSPAVLSAAAGVDPLALIPAEARGTARAAAFADAADFARAVAAQLEQAQQKKAHDVYLDLGADYARVTDRAAIYRAVQAIVFTMRDALPHRAGEVVQVYLRVGGRPAFGFRLHPAD